jgi:hypothetical protein
VRHIFRRPAAEEDIVDASYVTIPGGIEVVRLLHGAQDLDQILRDPD